MTILVLLIICLIFPPAMWVIIPLLLIGILLDR